MDLSLKEKFVDFWNRYFPHAELPIAFFYTDHCDREKIPSPPEKHRCVICDLQKARRGKTLCLDVNALGCPGAKRYFGFVQDLRPDFEYFLSCGIPGKMEGERYKKSPELVRDFMKHHPEMHAPGRYIVFKRWDVMEREDEPLVIIFFAPPDVLSGLFTLANFDESDPLSVIAPFSAGCSSIVNYPYNESTSDHQRAVLGMFDVSARPCVFPQILTFSVPMPKFVRMVSGMSESFLITDSWKKVRRRLKRSH